MAELAIGISKTAVQLLADKVKSAIKEEAKQWQILQQNLVFITGEFEMMQSFLNSADGERVKNHVVRTWVRQVRDLSNDVEDCIEFVLHLDTKRSWWLRLLPPCSCSSTEGSELPLDLAVTQIEQLKIRVQDVSQRNLRYRFGDSCSDSLTQQQFVSASAIGAPGFDDIHIEAKDTAASCRGAVDLTKLVTEGSNDLRVISLWGTGDDLGTMSIIRNMYDDPTIYRNFRCRAWVKKKRDALSWTETSAGDLVEEFVRQVNTNRYLIILEDLSTVVQWDAIRPYLRDRKNGSCIVVSTRHHEIASLCTGKPYLLSELQRFSANQAIRVFFNAKKASPYTAQVQPV
uniref:Rx N-terminal domain-containing protein n=1 Tax=Setaria italica TaxID=4555 RepID=K3ZJ37_SETIT